MAVQVRAFGVVIPCTLVSEYKHFGGTYSLHLYLNMENVCSSKTSVPTHEATNCRHPKNSKSKFRHLEWSTRLFQFCLIKICQTVWLLSSPARTLGFWVLIPLDAWMSVCAVLYVATGWCPVQGVLLTGYRITKLKKQPEPNKGLQRHWGMNGRF
jgi:hypothetical protein